jgi:transposase
MSSGSAAESDLTEIIAFDVWTAPPPGTRHRIIGPARCRLGHAVRLMPPAYVKPYVKRQKNDATDAEAICEAVARSKRLDAIPGVGIVITPGTNAPYGRSADFVNTWGSAAVRVS